MRARSSIPHACREWAEQFSEARFQREFSDCVDQAWDLWQRDPRMIETALTDGPAGLPAAPSLDDLPT